MYAPPGVRGRRRDGAPTLRGQRVVFLPVVTEHVPELRRILTTPQVRARWREVSQQWQFDDHTSMRFAVLLDDQVCGMSQYGEEDDPGYRHASIDIFLDPTIHNRGSAGTPWPPWRAT